jgi:hypothetical protein
MHFTLKHKNSANQTIFSCEFDLVVPNDYLGDFSNTSIYQTYSNFVLYDLTNGEDGTVMDPSTYGNNPVNLSFQYTNSPNLSTYLTYADSTCIYLRIALTSNANFNKAYRLDLLDPTAYALGIYTKIFHAPTHDTFSLQVQNSDNSITQNYVSAWQNPITEGQIAVVLNESLYCFNQGTMLLGPNGYNSVEDLKVGDLLSTWIHGHRKIKRILRGVAINKNLVKAKNTMCVMKKQGNMTADLYLTGGHSLMVEKLSFEEFKKQRSIGFSQKIDDKQLLLAMVSPLFEAAPPGTYQHYHFVLENDGNPASRYGVWANGVLCETPSQKYVETMSGKQS